MRILLVEDDAMIGRAVRLALGDEGHAIDWVRDAPSANIALTEPIYDLVLLDLGLPSGDGLDILRSMRRRGELTPVLIVTARDSVTQRITGLDAGADDYILKPFDLDELLARIRAVQRRHAQQPNPSWSCGDLVLTPSSKTASLAGQPLALSAKEYALLEVLMQHQHQSMTKQQLQDALYEWDSDVDSNVVEVFLYRLRRKIGNERISNQRGLGYRLEPVQQPSVDGHHGH